MIFLTLLVIGSSSAQGDTKSEDVEEDWHINQMISHHGGLTQWIKDYTWGVVEEGEVVEENEVEPITRSYGCHGWI